MSTHYSEDDLTLYYYGEGPLTSLRTGPSTRFRADVEHHLQECSACATMYREITGTLSLIVPEAIPERGDHYGLEVWQRIRHQLPEPEPRFARFTRFTRFAGFAGFTRFAGFSAAAAVVVIAAFVAGRLSMNVGTQNRANSANLANPANSANSANLANPDSRQRVLISSVADHLDRSERVLTDIMNASTPSDISMEQGWAEDLLSTSRLYRQDAVEAGEQSIATVLDDLERNLLEIVHSPSKISAADLEQLRRRIDAAALLFKVRVMSEQLRDREMAPADRQAPRASTSRIS